MAIHLKTIEQFKIHLHSSFILINFENMKLAPNNRLELLPKTKHVDKRWSKTIFSCLPLLFWNEWICPFTLDWKSSHLSYIQARRAASSLTVGQKQPVSPSQDSSESFSGKSFLRSTVSNSENERSQLKAENKMHFLLTLYGFSNLWTNDAWN